MKCYYHQEREAVGTCKNCSKGICAECASELENSIACKGICEERAKLIDSLIDRNVKASSRTGLFTLRSFLFTFLVGLVFIAYGFYSIDSNRFGLFSIIIGGIFVMVSIFTVLNARAIMGRKK